MSDLIVALGLVMVIEAYCGQPRRQLGLKLLAAAAHMPEHTLRAAGAARSRPGS